MKFSGIQWVLLLLICTLYMLVDSTYTLQASFFPSVAMSKNATALQYTVTFGIFDGTVAITSVLFGSLSVYFRPKTLFTFGCIVNGLSLIFFGLMNHINNLDLFLAVSILLRILEGAGCSAGFVGISGVIAELFTENKLFVMGLLDLTIPVGFLLGPLIGGFLYTVGGFFVPFGSIGTFIIFLFLIILHLISSTSDSAKSLETDPNNDNLKSTNSTDNNHNAQIPIFQFLRLPNTISNCFMIFAVSFGFGWILGTLQPYLEISFKVSTLFISLIFGGAGCLNALFSPFIGSMKPKFLPIVLSIGLLINFIGTALVGPLPILQINGNVAITAVGVCMMACGSGLVSFSAYALLYQDANSMESESPVDESHSLSMISGIYLFASSIGSMLGTMTGGYFYDSIGFRNATYVLSAFILLSVLLGLLQFFAASVKKCKNYKINRTLPKL